MYDFQLSEKFPCSPNELFERTLYNFDEYEKYAPNVTRVEVISREPLPDGREFITAQIFARAAIPAPIRAVFNMSPEMSWKEYYNADAANRTVDWRVETPVFTEHVDCGGTSSVTGAARGCELRITGSMKINIDGVRGIPPSVARAVCVMLEPFIGNMVTLNLKKYFGACGRRWRKKRRKSESGLEERNGQPS